MSPYYKSIKEQLFKTGHDGYDPRHIEAYMRCEHSTLDGLSKKSFDYEISVAIECIKVDGKVNAERLAKSFGL